MPPRLRHEATPHDATLCVADGSDTPGRVVGAPKTPSLEEGMIIIHIGIVYFHRSRSPVLAAIINILFTDTYDVKGTVFKKGAGTLAGGGAQRDPSCRIVSGMDVAAKGRPGQHGPKGDTARCTVFCVGLRKCATGIPMGGGGARCRWRRASYPRDGGRHRRAAGCEGGTARGTAF